jgi:hypothetical protein
MKEFERNTTSDRVDYPYLILQALQIINVMRTTENYDPSRVEEAITTLADMIPDSKRDDLFRKDVEAAVISEIEDRRPEWCTHKIGPRTPENQIVVVSVDHSKLLHALVNLVDRMELGLRTENKGWVGKREQG